ncbi:MAG: bifunctional phosphoribosyl-AMP cyclohydrolase/phosphoribosyl-ATP diphosphatase HisIE [Clostridiales bacterium]|jgi:phosphoribosyl-ATP pyrophosphohydrolase/phosphoribosyl-AMP cyclohydrolase|nr:bifunctional phosphoribosyl-AMP cyclohydrolase/phosphoribosyl-ATP diphosphatase HisIE [Clostridiales bacterium]
MQASIKNGATIDEIFEQNPMIPAIVQDYIGGQVLMLAYVNRQSYDYMVQNGETCFWSRSRNELWHKGETSGNTQRIVDMKFDCDNDTLLILVEQNGKGACHTGDYTCFGDYDVDIFDQVYSQIYERHANPVEKSYTNYLLNEGVDKICKKVGEEATEAIIAAKNGDRGEFIGEVADLVYHMLVLMFVEGVSVGDIKQKLIERHAKSGNLKDKNERGEY